MTNFDTSGEIPTVAAVATKARGSYIKWDRDILPILKEKLTGFRRQGIIPTIRGLLYILESEERLTKSDYHGLSRHLVKWREDGILPLNCVADQTRKIIDIHRYMRRGHLITDFDENLQTWNQLITPREHLRCVIDYLQNAAEDIYKHVPRWLDQPRYVEVFVEKNAMASSFNSILNSGDNPRMVIINPSHGWSSYTFVTNNINRLISQRNRGKDVFVQYYGDSDPTGERMTAPDSKLVRRLRAEHINFERIAINEDTISEFGLEGIRDKELDYNTLKKLRSDPNYEWFTVRHNGQIWQIELDALLYNPEKFRELVLTNVDKHFNTSIQNEAIERFKAMYPVRDINRQILEDVEKLRNRLVSTD